MRRSAAPHEQDVVITGCGVVSPLARSATELVERVLRGESVLRSLGIAGSHEVCGAMFDKVPLDTLPERIQTRLDRLDRLCRLFLAAAYGAVSDAGLLAAMPEGESFGLSFGTGLGCLLTNAEYFEKVVTGGAAAASPRLFAYTVSNAAAGEVSIALGARGPNLTTHAGTVAGLQAVGYAADVIASGKADVMLAGGADALGETLLQGLSELGATRARPARPFIDEEPGINPSEGAALVVLESAQHARRRGARVIAKVAGYAMGSEPSLTHANRQSMGIESTLRRALERAGCFASSLETIVTSAHGTALDAIERQALRAVGCDETHLLAPKANWGECFAASGALGVVLAAALAHKQDALALVHGLCYSGPAVALVVAPEGSP